MTRLSCETIKMMHEPNGRLEAAVEFAVIPAGKTADDPERIEMAHQSTAQPHRHAVSAHVGALDATTSCQRPSKGG